MPEKELRTPTTEIPTVEGDQAVTVQRGRTVYLEDGVGSGVFILRAGRVLIFNTLEGGKRVSDLILAPSLIGSEVLHGAETYQNSATAYDTCSVQSINKERLNELAQSHPELSMSLLKLESTHTLRLRRRIYSQRVGAQASVARVLLDIAEGEQFEINRVSHQIIGEIAGAARETTSVIMKDFEDRGLIEGSGSTRKIILRPDLLGLVSRIGIPSPDSKPTVIFSAPN